MKVYIYNKKDRHKRIDTIENVIRVEEKEDRFTIIEENFIRREYHKEHYMVSIYCY